MKHTTIIQQAIASQRARSSKRKGDQSEGVIMDLMHCLRFTCIRKIETGWRIKRSHITHKIMGASPIKAVAGDIRAIFGDGRGVLVEVKHRADNMLSYGDLEDHQHASLLEHQKSGAMSLVGFSCSLGVLLFEYQDPELSMWSKGRPLQFGEMDDAFERLKVRLEFPRI